MRLFRRKQSTPNSGATSAPDPAKTAEEMTAFAKQLRKHYQLDEEPTDLSPVELRAYRREVAKIKRAV